MGEPLTNEQIQQVVEGVKHQIDLAAQAARLTPTQIDTVADASIKSLQERFYLIPQQKAGWLKGGAVMFLVATIGLGYSAALKGTSDKLAEAGVMAGVNRIREGAIEADKFLAGFAQVPIGTIVAWHKHPGRYLDKKSPPIDAKPPAGWMECNGQALDDQDSPLYRCGARNVPNLNGDQNGSTAAPASVVTPLFLRGSTESGNFEPDTIRRHQHGPARVGASFVLSIPNTDAGPGSFLVGMEPPTFLGRVINQTGDNIDCADETRPKSMSVVWIIRVR